MKHLALWQCYQALMMQSGCWLNFRQYLLKNSFQMQSCQFRCSHRYQHQKQQFRFFMMHWITWRLCFIRPAGYLLGCLMKLAQSWMSCYRSLLQPSYSSCSAHLMQKHHHFQKSGLMAQQQRMSYSRPKKQQRHHLLLYQCQWYQGCWADLGFLKKEAS